MENLVNVTSLAETGEGSLTDLAISAKTLETRKEILRLERQIGFRRVCINTEVDTIWTPGASKKKKKKDDDRDSPLPLSSPVPHPAKSLNLEQDGCRLYSRLTFPLTDPIQLNKMAVPDVLAYDVIAVEPANEKLFHKVCTESEHIDLITFNYFAGNAPAFKVQPGVVKVAQERGIHFEIVVGPGLRSSASAKQNLISYARKIVNATKGRNIVLSIGALKPAEVRGPYDLMNLGVLFGMNQSQAKDAVSKNFDAVLRHSLTRKSGGCVVTVTRRVHLSQKTKDQMAQLKKLKDVISSETMKRDEQKPETNGRVNDVGRASNTMTDGKTIVDSAAVDASSEKRKASSTVDCCDAKKPRILES